MFSMMTFFVGFVVSQLVSSTRKIQISAAFPSKSALFAHTYTHLNIITTYCEQREEEEERAHQHHHHRNNKIKV
jgi:hypothetical protein